MKLQYTDKSQDPAGWAKELGVSREAIDIYLASDVLDLHIETFIWQRIVGYDMHKRHGREPFGARCLGQIDMPRAREACLTGGTWSISTYPLRTAEGRARAFVENQAWLKRILETADQDYAVCRNLGEYRAARRAGKHGAFLGIQGGNALDRDLDALDLIEDDLILRVTLVHLYNSRLGTTSAPAFYKGEGLTAFGKQYVERLNGKRILVDLAHISRDGFMCAVEVHDQSQPLIVTHTGIDAVHPHWRNITDQQIRAVVDTGGTIGIIYQMAFLGGKPAKFIVDHMAHVIEAFGDDFVSLGSDWDGMILPPRDMPTCLELPRLVQIMLDRGWRAERIRKILGGNFLRVLGQLRGDDGATS
ncbi:MAG: hypothetical protein A2138_09675 [Deltaproteobacteria bacterium RBG_16_71_12]|nr:MAG: hypothetical protein A2138_09675 [Deltaproteobacteria bacterium RBG_16_71_12]